MIQRINEPLYTDYLYHLVDEQFEGDYTRLFPEFTLYDNSHKQELMSKIFNHYKYFEIGYETYIRFIHEFREKVIELIPLANKYYKVIENPHALDLYNNTLTRDYTVVKEGYSNRGKTKTVSDSKDQFKDTPYTSYPSDTIYNTNVTDRNENVTNEQLVDSSMSETDTHDEEYRGLHRMSAMEIIAQIKDNLFDVDMWFIRELRDLFMEVY